MPKGGWDSMKKKRAEKVKPSEIFDVPSETVVHALSPDLDSVKNGKYNADLYTGGRHYLGSGNTVLEALEGITVRATHVKGVLRVTHKDQMREKILVPNAMNRLFAPSSRIVKEIAYKNILVLFDGI